MPRTTLVTGSANGIGAATRELLLARGDRVIGLDLDDADIRADLCTTEGRAAALREAARLAGDRLDAVVACAGLACPDTDAMIGVNYFGTVALIEGLCPLLARSEAGRAAVVVSSAAILRPDPALVDACLAGDEPGARAIGAGVPELVYASTKLALARWARRTSIRPEWAGAGILLNGIAPGTVVTNMSRPLLATAEGRAVLAKATPIAVAAHAGPADVAPLLAFLASGDCRYMVGQIIFIDGDTDVLRRGEALPGEPSPRKPPQH